MDNEVSIEREDIVKFYELNKHYDPMKCYLPIGIVGDTKKVEKYVNTLYKDIKKNDSKADLIVSNDKTRYNIMLSTGLEIRYVKIESVEDLDKNMFRKYI